LNDYLLIGAAATAITAVAALVVHHRCWRLAPFNSRIQPNSVILNSLRCPVRESKNITERSAMKPLATAEIVASLGNPHLLKNRYAQ
jgi:hypothetical protein